MKCKVEDCELEACTSGLCMKHYTRVRRHGTTSSDNPKEKNQGKKCLIPECEQEAKSKGFCRHHYIKQYRLTEKGAEVMKKYLNSDKRKEKQKKYQSSEKYKEVDTRKRHKRRVAVYSGDYEIFNKYEVFDRDLWICGICGLPVDKDLVYPEHMSASLDHIIPISKGGAHSFNNCQLAHLSCNCSKGNRIKEQSCEPVGDS